MPATMGLCFVQSACHNKINKQKAHTTVIHMSHTSVQCTHSAQLNTAQLTFTFNVTDAIVISVLGITLIGIILRTSIAFVLLTACAYVHSQLSQSYCTAQLIPAAATTVMP